MLYKIKGRNVTDDYVNHWLTSRVSELDSSTSYPCRASRFDPHRTSCSRTISWCVPIGNIVCSSSTGYGFPRQLDLKYFPHKGLHSRPNPLVRSLRLRESLILGILETSPPLARRSRGIFNLGTLPPDYSRQQFPCH